MATTYAGSGVSISAAERALARMRPHIERTHTDRVLAGIGPFAGGVRLKPYLDEYHLRDPVLCTTIDGPGTIPIVARLARDFGPGTFRPLGASVAKHCFADLACSGAFPFQIVDNIGSTDVDELVYEEILAGMADACCEMTPVVAIVGGEMAQLPGLIIPGETDFCACACGLVDDHQLLRPQESIKPGNVILGIESSCIALNGMSMARNIMLTQLGMKANDIISATGNTVREDLLREQPNYALAVLAGRSEGFCATAHSNITGGGLYDNIKRNLPEGCRAMIDPGTWEALPLFGWLIEQGNVELPEAYHTWNMNIGFVQIFTTIQLAEEMIAFLAERFCLRAWIIGWVASGQKGVEIVGVA